MTWPHSLIAEVFAVLPVCEPVTVADITFRVYDRFNYAAEDGDVPEAAVADRLRRLRAEGSAERIGDLWRRVGARL